ncbi:MAG: energy-coupling factor transporter transmembrane protein EcfT [Lachnospiraceae bacterium]|jgi:energy-coupling factor transport system permease protein|nr:energy-coupling factor transporter transmembrane protein EcfT [Lachnospiraceae bacterium]
MEQYHPIVNFIYFAVVIGLSMSFLHPICLIISITGAVAYALFVFGADKVKRGFVTVFILMLLTALINPTFSHQGVTELYMLPSGNMLTLESIWFGIGAAFMLGASLVWFRTMGEILTADKIIYLFGKTFPILGLLLSMILGFIPKLKYKYEQIKLCGNGVKLSGLAGIKHKIKQLSLLVTWMLEDSVEMGKSMRGRGYGIEGRINYSIYRFAARDGVMLIIIIALASYVIIGKVSGVLYWSYYPITEGAKLSAYGLSVYVAYFVLCMCAVFEEIRKDIVWKKSMSAI